MRERLYGFPWKTLPTGERAPDCAFVIRLVMHFFWLAAWHLVPTYWMLERSGPVRNRIGTVTIQSLSWWAYQHRRFRGYSEQEWKRLP